MEVPFLGVLIMRTIDDYSILGSLLGFPYFGKLPFQNVWRSMNWVFFQRRGARLRASSLVSEGLRLGSKL